MKDVWILTLGEHGLTPFVFAELEDIKRSFKLTYSNRIEDSPTIVYENERKVMWNDGSVASLVPLYTNYTHL